MSSRISLTIRKCRESCRHYYAEGEDRSCFCTYNSSAWDEVVPDSRCKYELLTENTARRFFSLYVGLFAAIFDHELAITLSEAKERIKNAANPNSKV